MLKEEFEKRIGKTVEWETYELYNAMYSATDLDKDQFVALLNIKAIPESAAAVKAREETKKLRQAVMATIKQKQQEIEDAKESLNYYKEQIAICGNDLSDTQRIYCRNQIDNYKRHIATLRNEIATAKRLMLV